MSTTTSARRTAGGKFGVQSDRVDKNAHSYEEEPEKVGTNYERTRPEGNDCHKRSSPSNLLPIDPPSISLMQSYFLVGLFFVFTSGLIALTYSSYVQRTSCPLWL